MQKLDAQLFKTKIFDFEANKEWKFAGQRPAIVDFYADWCGPCRAQAPILEEIAGEYNGKVDVYKVDTDAHPELAAMFGVRGIPALLFIPMVGEPAMSSGMVAKDGLKKAIRELFQVDG